MRTSRKPLGGTDYETPVHFEARSLNSKLSHVAWDEEDHATPQKPYVAATTVSIALTCPDYCDLKAGGCFANETKTRMKIVRLDQAGEKLRPVGKRYNHCPNSCEHVDTCYCPEEEWPSKNEALVVSINEARRINRAQPKGQPLRLHIGGEVSCTYGAALLGQAAARWRRRGGGPVWTYTKRWPEIVRRVWGDDVAVMASVTTKEIHRFPEIAEKGYAPALLVERFPRRKGGPKGQAFRLGGVWFTPCKNEVSGNEIKCVECRYCMMADRPLDEGVAFEAHGTRPEKAQAACRTAPDKRIRLRIEDWG